MKMFTLHWAPKLVGNSCKISIFQALKLFSFNTQIYPNPFTLPTFNVVLLTFMCYSQHNIYTCRQGYKIKHKRRQKIRFFPMILARVVDVNDLINDHL